MTIAILSVLLGATSLLLFGQAHAVDTSPRETEPIHLAGCPASANMVLTSLAAAVDSPTIYRGGMVRGQLGGTLLKQQGQVIVWNAATQLDTRNTARQLSTSTHDGKLVPLHWNNLNDTQRASLRLATESDDAMAIRRLAYLTGDRIDEMQAPNSLFAPRFSILGAVVHGIALHVGPPALMVAPGYQEYYERHRNRRALVYVGASDGMLHAFADDTGEEVFAYAPRASFNSLIKLTTKSSPASVPFDGGMASSSVLINGAWRTVLVAGFGMAAKGLMALDVSDTANLPASNALLWEFADQDDPDIAHVIGAPQILRVRTMLQGGKQQYAYFVVVTGGLNPRAGNALFFLSLDKKPAETWQLGTNYFKVVTDSAVNALSNGMLEFVSVMGHDQAVERIYAGDLQGNIWRFDLASGLPAHGVSARRLFTATDSAGKRQPVMHKLSVVAAPDGKHLLLFGTGRYLVRQDLQPDRFATQSFYAVRDADSTVSRSQLASRRLLTDSGSNRLTVDGSPFSYADANNSRAGWYMDFPDSSMSGERVVSPLLSVGSQIVFRSLLPEGGPCQAPMARVYAMDASSGLTIVGTTTGIPISAGSALGTLLRVVPMPIRHETTAFPESSKPDRFGRRRYAPKVELLREDNTPLVLDGLSIPDVVGGRLSWRELSEWAGK
ncbi:PilC/PilY family type IV pilus protein [uncultured Oxalicibacterium sp.]|uniref:pilus assembly protein n=1 Tax=uncultured Oxalicibacterium sp. TaxID=1168540 RepID=UPI0025D66FC5|nr:PilC/PilY family type IV pilus protein [uncultured Oxalicibacterium sp.]